MANPWAEPEQEAAMRKRIGAALRVLRQERGMYLKDASERSGVSWSYLSEIERGVKLPTLPTLVALCEAYGILVTEFLGDIYPFGTHQLPV